MYSKIGAYTQDKLQTLLTGFRKRHSTHRCFMYLLEIWKNILDKEKYVRAMFMDLLKAYDTIHHGLLIASLGVYDFSQDAPQYMKGCLTNKQQGVPVNSNFSTWENIISGIPQALTSLSMIFSFCFKFTFK